MIASLAYLFRRGNRGLSLNNFIKLMFSVLSALVLCPLSAYAGTQNIDFVTEYPDSEVYSLSLASDDWGPNVDTTALMIKYVIQTNDSTVIILKGLNRQDFKYSSLQNEFYILQANGDRKKLKSVDGAESSKYYKIILKKGDEIRCVFEKVDVESNFSIFAVADSYYGSNTFKTWKIFSDIDLVKVKEETGSQFIDSNK